MLFICLTVFCVDFSTWVALARYLGISIVTTRRAIASLVQGLSDGPLQTFL